MTAQGSRRPGNRPVPTPPQVQRWFQQERSPYDHEQEALDHVRDLMPNAEPFRAWATFTFTAGSGRVNECDLFIVVPRGLYLVELKGHPGRATNSGSLWSFHSDRVRKQRNPLHLTDLKSKELRGRLRWAADKLQFTGLSIPRVEPAVFLSAPDLQSELDEQQKLRVYGRNDRSTGLPKIWDDLLGHPAGGQRTEAERREFFRFALQLPKLMQTIGVHAAPLRFGEEWELDRRPFDGGPNWEDRLAIRQHPFREEGRVRVYLASGEADESLRGRISRAAEREYQVLQGINHRGIAQALQFREDRGGPAILFRHRATDMRLDHYLSAHAAALTPEARLRLIRQLADALRYAHSRSLYHRALAARSVYVNCRNDGSRPVLRIIDWQVAARDFETTGLSPTGISPVHGEHIAETADLYLAPEFDDQPHADPGDLDLFGLGAVAYLILTGYAPAVDRPELKRRLRVDGGLRPRAVSDEVPEQIDELIYSVTRADVAERLESVEAFVAGLDSFEQDTADPDESAEGEDPLSAGPGHHVGSGWTVERVLGTGATARALLVRRDGVDSEGTACTEQRVLKVALDEERSARLRDEADALDKVGGGHVVRLLDGPRVLHGHTVLDLEFAGANSLGVKLRADGPLTDHELKRFGDDLLVALDQLAAHGVRHRDIKPDNLGVFQRNDRSWQLKLFDFSLTKASGSDLKVGTSGYMDPFLDSDVRRRTYDDHAEMYAAAVTLHEMASGERPRWGDGMSSPAVLDEETPTLSKELFDSTLSQGLEAFFERALHRDADRRFDTLQQMRNAWHEVFASVERTAPASTPATVEGEEGRADLEADRERAARSAQLDTPLGAAGLTPAAESAAGRLGATTVGELLKVEPYQISKARGTGARARKELNRRRREWMARLGEQASAAIPGNAASAVADAEGQARPGVEELARLVIPQVAGRSRKPEVVRLLLGLPAADGTPSPLPPWCAQSEVAAHLGVKQPTVSRHHREAIEEWSRLAELTQVREELIGLVRAAGRVATIHELAEELRVRRGVREDQERGRVAVLALAVVRAAVEAEVRTPGVERPDEGEEPRLAVARRGGHVLVVAEPAAGSEDPAPAVLADYARSLGAAADQLAAFDPLPGRAAVLRTLREVSAPEDIAPLADTRLVSLAAAVSANALYSPRLELYPRDLTLSRALRISQAASGVHREHGASVEELLARVYSRFPDLQLGQPTRPEVEEALHDARFQLQFNSEEGRFYPPAPLASAGTRSSTMVPSPAAQAASASAAAGRDPQELLRQQLSEAARRGGFLAVTLPGTWLAGVAERLSDSYGLHRVDLGALFLSEFRALAADDQTWQAVLAHDAHYSAAGELTPHLASYVKAAWQRTGERLGEQIASAGRRTVVLLHGAGLAARYYDAGGRELLTRWQNAARRPRQDPHGLWLLCPGPAPSSAPQLDNRAVEVLGEHERAILDRGAVERFMEADAAA